MQRTIYFMMTHVSTLDCKSNPQALQINFESQVSKTHDLKYINLLNPQVSKMLGLVLSMHEMCA